MNGAGGAPIDFAVRWVSASLRAMKLEMEIEEGVDPPADAQFQGRTMSIESCLLDAGLEVEHAGHEDRIPANTTGWDVSGLHTLMQDFAQESLSERAWTLHLLLLNDS